MTVILFSKMILPVIILKEDLDLFVAVINRGQSHNSLPARLSGQFEVIWGHWSHCHQSQLVSFMWASLEISSNMYYLFLLYRSWTCWTDIGKGWFNVVDFLLFNQNLSVIFVKLTWRFMMQLKRIPYFVSFGKWLRHTSLGFLPLAFQDLIFFCDVQHEVNLIELGKCSGKMSFTLLMINYFSIWRLLWNNVHY